MTLGQTTFLRFVVTGVVTAGTYVALSLALERVLPSPLVASLTAYAIVVLLHFTLSNFFTFQQKAVDRRSVLRYLAFIAAFGVLNLIVAQVVHAFEWPSYVLYVSNAVISPLFSFVVMKSFVFVGARDARL